MILLGETGLWVALQSFWNRLDSRGVFNASLHFPIGHLQDSLVMQEAGGLSQKGRCLEEGGAWNLPQDACRILKLWEISQRPRLKIPMKQDFQGSGCRNQPPQR